VNIVLRTDALTLAIAEICDFWRNSSDGGVFEKVQQLFHTRLDPEHHSTKIMEQFILRRALDTVKSALQNGSPATPKGLSDEFMKLVLRDTTDRLKAFAASTDADFKDENAFIEQANRRRSDFRARIQRWSTNGSAMPTTLEEMALLLKELSAP
jgi:hypothetical protein